MAKSDPTPEPTPEDIAFLEAVKAGKAPLDQGRGVPYEAVRPWLMSWGTDDELPPPECE
jgi:predicted transcriptional regulator